MENAIPLTADKQSPRSARPSRGERWVTAGLILLAVIPVLAGAVRVGQLIVAADTTPITPQNERFFASPLPVILHIIGSSVYALLGAFQFAPTFRLRHPRWHRRTGWLLVPCGLAASLTGLWMAHFYPWPANDGYILYVMRLFFGLLMTLALVLAVITVLQRKFAPHGAWMVRAYAIGMGAGTQVLTQIVWVLLVGTSGELARNVVMGSGWVINLLIAEWVIYRRLTRPQRKSARAANRT